MATETISQDLADLLATKNFDITYKDKDGRDCAAGEAVTFSFDWVAPSGKNYGTAVAVIGDGNDLMFFFGDNLGRSMENPEDKNAWYQFLEQLSNFATKHKYLWSPTDISQLKHTLAGIAAIKEGLFEGYYGTKKVSYMGEATEARLVIKHKKALGENDRRHLHVESLFIETADGERFKLPFRKLSGARAMLEHVRQGGKPYDIRGNHICEMVNEINLLARFKRASHGRVFEGITANLIESAQDYYHTLQGNIKHLASSRGYQMYFESWSPADISSQDALVEDIKTLFVEQSIDSRIESALPLLAKIQQGTEMKEIQVFESWINTMAEGTWTLPDTPEQEAKLKELMSAELIAGPDGSNATEQLYDLVGDDHLFDLIQAAAEADPNSNIWDNAEIVGRLGELGVDVSDITQRGAEQNSEPQQQDNGYPMDEADTVNSFAESGTVAGGMAPVQGSLEENNLELDQATLDLIDEYIAKFEPTADRNEIIQSVIKGTIHPSELEYALSEDQWGQAKQDPMNYNAAITGSYYEEEDPLERLKVLSDGWKGTLAGSALGGMAGDAAGTAIGPVAGGAIGGAVGGVPGAIAGTALGALAGGPVGAAAGSLAGGKIGDALGGSDDDDKVKEMKTGEIVKAATKAATQGIGDWMGGSGSKDLLAPLVRESETNNAKEDPLARIKSLALFK